MSFLKKIFYFNRFYLEKCSRISMIDMMLPCEEKIFLKMPKSFCAIFIGQIKILMKKKI